MAVFDFSKLTDFSTYHEQSFVALALFFYLAISKKATAKFRDLVGLDPKSPFLKAFVFLHNAALAVFSLVVFLKSTPLVVSHYAANGWESLHCSSAFWNEGFGFWANIFYISKYYEFVDSWILILKGKECSFLQVYHHTGIGENGTKSKATILYNYSTTTTSPHLSQPLPCGSALVRRPIGCYG